MTVVNVDAPVNNSCRAPACWAALICMRSVTSESPPERLDSKCVAVQPKPVSQFVATPIPLPFESRGPTWYEL